MKTPSSCPHDTDRECRHCASARRKQEFRDKVHVVKGPDPRYTLPGQVGRPKTQKNQRYLERIERYLRAKPLAHATEIADAIGIKQPHITAVCREVRGITFTDYRADLLRKMADEAGLPPEPLDGLQDMDMDVARLRNAVLRAPCITSSGIAVQLQISTLYVKQLLSYMGSSLSLERAAVVERMTARVPEVA